MLSGWPHGEDKRYLYLAISEHNFLFVSFIHSFTYSQIHSSIS